jgi:hypothetical protein
VKRIFHSVVTLHRVKKICNGFDLHPKEDCQISEFGNPREVFLRRGRRHGKPNLDNNHSCLIFSLSISYIFNCLYMLVFDFLSYLIAIELCS